MSIKARGKAFDESFKAYFGVEPIRRLNDLRKDLRHR
jgi:hypothetical protein